MASGAKLQDNEAEEDVAELLLSLADAPLEQESADEEETNDGPDAQPVAVKREGQPAPITRINVAKQASPESGRTARILVSRAPGSWNQGEANLHLLDTWLATYPWQDKPHRDSNGFVFVVSGAAGVEYESASGELVAQESADFQVHVDSRIHPTFPTWIDKQNQLAAAGQLDDPAAHREMTAAKQAALIRSKVLILGAPSVVAHLKNAPKKFVFLAESCTLRVTFLDAGDRSDLGEQGTSGLFADTTSAASDGSPHHTSDHPFQPRRPERKRNIHPARYRMMLAGVAPDRADRTGSTGRAPGGSRPGSRLGTSAKGGAHKAAGGYASEGSECEGVEVSGRRRHTAEEEGDELPRWGRTVKRQHTSMVKLEAAQNPPIKREDPPAVITTQHPASNLAPIAAPRHYSPQIPPQQQPAPPQAPLNHPPSTHIYEYIHAPTSHPYNIHPHLQATAVPLTFSHLSPHPSSHTIHLPTTHPHPTHPIPHPHTHATPFPDPSVAPTRPASQAPKPIPSLLPSGAPPSPSTWPPLPPDNSSWHDLARFLPAALRLVGADAAMIHRWWRWAVHEQKAVGSWYKLLTMHWRRAAGGKDITAVRCVFESKDEQLRNNSGNKAPLPPAHPPLPAPPIHLLPAPEHLITEAMVALHAAGALEEADAALFARPLLSEAVEKPRLSSCAVEVAAAWQRGDVDAMMWSMLGVLPGTS